MIKVLLIATLASGLLTVALSISTFLRQRTKGSTATVVAPHHGALDAGLFEYRSRWHARCELGIITGDIRWVNYVDVWVNGENTHMQMARVLEDSISAIIRYRGGVWTDTGRAIDDRVGKELAEVVGTAVPVLPGSTFVTKAHNLTASNNVRYVIHVAAVEAAPEVGFRQVIDIGQCVTNALARAEDLTSKTPPAMSILFPLIGTGVGGGDVESTVEAMLRATLAHLQLKSDTSLSKIYFLAYTEHELRVLQSAFWRHRLAPKDDAAEVEGSNRYAG